MRPFCASESPATGLRRRKEVQSVETSGQGTIVLVATYHGCCREWITGGNGCGRYYNVPFHRDDKEAERSNRISIAFLYGDDGSTVYCRLSYDRVVSRAELESLGYPSKGKPHSDKYILFSVTDELSPQEVAAVKANPQNKFYVFADAFSKNRGVHLRRLSTFLSNIVADKKSTACARNLLPKEIASLSAGRLGRFPFEEEDGDAPINLESLWIIGPRAKGAKRFNCYHGNFAPQVPNDLIRRYTSPGDLVLDMFTGSGTTLFECERLGRDFVGFDVNEEIVAFVNSQMDANSPIRYEIHVCDVTDSECAEKHIEEDLEKWNKPAFDFVIMHPPYLDIVKFTDKPCDLSGIYALEEFVARFRQSVATCVRHLAPKRYFALVVGDVYRNGEVVPLGFRLMDAVKSAIHCKLKGILVKDITGNRGKIGQDALWRARAMRGGYYLFKHEYVFVFRKED